MVHLKHKSTIFFDQNEIWGPISASAGSNTSISNAYANPIFWNSRTFGPAQYTSQCTCLFCLCLKLLGCSAKLIHPKGTSHVVSSFSINFRKLSLYHWNLWSILDFPLVAPFPHPSFGDLWFVSLNLCLSILWFTVVDQGNSVIYGDKLVVRYYRLWLYCNECDQPFFWSVIGLFWNSSREYETGHIWVLSIFAVREHSDSPLVRLCRIYSPQANAQSHFNQNGIPILLDLSADPIPDIVCPCTLRVITLCNSTTDMIDMSLHV